MSDEVASWNPGGGAYDTSANRKNGKGKSIQKRQRPTEVNTALAFAGGDSRIEIPTAPTKNPKSETMTSTQDDAELLKDLRGMGKPPLFNGNDTDVSFFPVSEDDSILLRRADDAVDASPWTTYMVAEHIKRAESLQSEGDQQSEINSTQRRATRSRQC